MDEAKENKVKRQKDKSTMWLQILKMASEHTRARIMLKHALKSSSQKSEK